MEKKKSINSSCAESICGRQRHDYNGPGICIWGKKTEPSKTAV